MRIGVDMRAVLTGQISGVEHYTISVLTKLIEIDHTNTYVLFYVSYKDADKLLADLLTNYPILKNSNVEVRPLKWINFPLSLHAFFKPLDWPKADIVCGGLDVMWMPAPRMLPLTRKCRKVTTFHDLIFLIFPQFYTLSSRIWQWQMNYGYEARVSDAIIAVSKSTKRDIVRLLHANPGKIEVIYEGVGEEYFAEPDEQLFSELKQKWQLPEKYVYFVGSIEPRKNLISVVRALKQLEETSGDTINLVVSGGKSWLSSELYQTITELNLTNRVIFTGRVSEAEKIALLNHALVFAFPSYYEGFGLMVLEAMAAGCPVITSNNSALPEVAGDVGILIEPTDVNKLASEIKKLSDQSEIRANLVRRGQEFAKNFSWEKTAKATLKVLEGTSHHHDR